MLLLEIAKDGGPDSKVMGFWFFRAKPLFTVALLRFANGTRDAFHSHAFHSVSWVLRGELEENRYAFEEAGRIFTSVSRYLPSWRPIFTSRRNLHRVESKGTTWVLTFRGPWAKTWQEITESGETITLTHNRRRVA